MRSQFSSSAGEPRLATVPQTVLNLGRSPRLGGLCLTGVCLALLLAGGGHAADQPLGWWTFDADQVQGATVVDRAGKHDGSIQGAVRLTKGPLVPRPD